MLIARVDLDCVRMLVLIAVIFKAKICSGLLCVTISSVKNMRSKLTAIVESWGLTVSDFC